MSDASWGRMHKSQAVQLPTACTAARHIEARSMRCNHAQRGTQHALQPCTAGPAAPRTLRVEVAPQGRVHARHVRQHDGRCGLWLRLLSRGGGCRGAAGAWKQHRRPRRHVQTGKHTCPPHSACYHATSKCSAKATGSPHRPPCHTNFPSLTTAAPALTGVLRHEVGHGGLRLHAVER